MPDKFDEMLSAALSECFDEEIKAIEHMEKVQPSAQWKKDVLSLCKKEKARTVFRFRRILGRCAIFVLVFFSSVSLMLLTAPEVQASVKNVLTIWSKEAVTFIFDGKLSNRITKIKGFDLRYLPEGFSLVDSYVEAPSYFYYEWVNSQEDRLILECMLISETAEYGYDQEHGEISFIDLDKTNLLFLKSNDPNYPHHITWSENNYLVNLTIPFDILETEIVKISNNILFITKEN